MRITSPGSRVITARDELDELVRAERELRGPGRLPRLAVHPAFDGQVGRVELGLDPRARAGRTRRTPCPASTARPCAAGRARSRRSAGEPQDELAGLLGRHAPREPPDHHGQLALVVDRELAIGGYGMASPGPITAVDGLRNMQRLLGHVAAHLDRVLGVVPPDATTFDGSTGASSRTSASGHLLAGRDRVLEERALEWTNERALDRAGARCGCRGGTERASRGAGYRVRRGAVTRYALRMTGHAYSHGADRPRIDPTAFVAPGARIVGDVTIRARASIWFNAVLRADNDAITHRRPRRTSRTARSCTRTRAILVIVGDGCTIGHIANVHGCRIGDGSLVGMGAIILTGAMIGEESLVAAGALVPEGKTLGPRSLLVGSPARSIRQLTDDEVERLIRRSTLHYLQFAKDYASTNVNQDS